MRPLRPAALLTDTSIRFLLAIAALTSASLYLFQALWFVVRGQVFLDAVNECPPIGVGSVATLDALVAQQRLAEACRSGVSREQAMVEVLGLGLVLVVAWLIYRAWPRLRERRAHLAVPDPRDSEALLAAVASLAEDAGVDPAPSVRIDATNPRLSGLAYGAGRDMRIGMGGGLVVAQVLDPPAFQAVVRHELGHIASRDVRWTYYAVSAWWSFVVVALAPVVVAFAFRDIDYLLRLGWRTAVLSALVALTVAALLRTRELYADARALEWGSGRALDRILAASPPKATRRPAALRLHPEPERRRLVLADPDGLFSASGWVAMAAALAAGSAFFSIFDLLTLLAPNRALALSGLIVAPLLALVLCCVTWRVALREAVRGVDLPAVLPLGLGVGVGLAIAPLLSVQAALGTLFVGSEAWAGYAVWAVGMVLISLLLARWVCDTARLGVTAALGMVGGPRRPFVGHVVAVTAIVAVWLAASVQALLLLSNLGPAAALRTPIWDVLPALALGSGPIEISLILAALLLAVPAWAWIRLRRGSEPAAWFWRDDRPTQRQDQPTVLKHQPMVMEEQSRVVGDQPVVLGDVPAVAGDQPTASVDEPPAPEARQALPSLLAVALPGVGAGLVAGLFPLAILLVGEGIDASVRTSDAFALAFGLAIETALLAAGLVAGVLAAVTMPRRWWPAALGSALLAMVVAGLLAWVVLTANRFGLLEHSSGASGLLGARASRIILVRPAAEAALPCALAVAIVASLRLLLPRPAPSTARYATHGRSALTGLAAAGLAAVLLVPTLARVGQLTEPVLATDALELTVPVGWEGSLDAGSGGVVLETTAMDVRILIVPTAAAAPSLGTGAIVVGGVEAPVVLVQDRGPERIVVFDARTPSGVQRITVVGSPEALTRRTTELESLFSAVRWLVPD